MRRTHRRINICRMAKNYPRLPISMSSLPFSPFNFTYIWYLPLTLRLQYTDNIFNVDNFTLSLTFSVCIIAMPHPQGKLNFPAWAHSQNRGWDPQQHVTKSWLSPHQHWKHAFEIMIETPSPRNHAPCLDISSQHTFWLSFTWSLQPPDAQIKLRSSAMVIIPHRTVQFFHHHNLDPHLLTQELDLPEEALISMTISWHGPTQHYHRADNLSLHSPWSTALSQHSIIFGKHPILFFMT